MKIRKLEEEEKEVENKCKRCGLCCKCILVNYSHRRFFADIESKMSGVKFSGDLLFVLNNFVPISEDEVRAINPFVLRFKKENDERGFYKCIKYSDDTKGCSDYENRPKVCSGFPFYDRYVEVESDHTYGYQCGFYEKDFIVNHVSEEEKLANEIELGFRKKERLFLEERRG